MSCILSVTLTTQFLGRLLKAVNQYLVHIVCVCVLNMSIVSVMHIESKPLLANNSKNFQL